jgi:hypothetical protein
MNSRGSPHTRVDLDKAKITPDFIKSQLRWFGKSYHLYLCNTSILRKKHINALKKESLEVLQLLGRNQEVIPNTVPLDINMTS